MNITANGNQGRGAVVTFSHKSSLEVKFSDNTTKEAFDGAIGNLTYRSGSSRILEALDYALKHMFKQKNGMRKNSEKVAVLITDGKDKPVVNDSKYKEMVAKFNKEKIKVVVIGVGSEVKEEQLRILAPHDYFPINNFIGLNDMFAGTVVEDVCNGNIDIRI